MRWPLQCLWMALQALVQHPNPSIVSRCLKSQAHFKCIWILCWRATAPQPRLWHCFNYFASMWVKPLVDMLCTLGRSSNGKVNNHFWIGLSSIENDKFSMHLYLSNGSGSPRMNPYRVEAAFRRVAWFNEWFHSCLQQTPWGIVGVPKYHASNYEATNLLLCFPRILQTLAALICEINSLAIKSEIPCKALIKSKICYLVRLVISGPMNNQNFVDFGIQPRPRAHLRWQCTSHNRNSLAVFQLFSDLVLSELIVLPNANVANLLEPGDPDIPHALAVPIVIHRARINQGLPDFLKSIIPMIQFSAHLCLQLAVHSPRFLQDHLGGMVCLRLQSFLLLLQLCYFGKQLAFLLHKTIPFALEPFYIGVFRSQFG